MGPGELLALLPPALTGAALGTLVGVLPGIGPAATMALLLPVSFAMEAQAAIVLLCGVYFGAQYGSSTTAILVNMPGEASGVVTAAEGFRMAKAGRAGTALAIAALASLVAGLLSAAFIALATPPLARLALSLSAADIAALVLLAIAMVIVVAERALHALAMFLTGCLIGFVGADFGGGLPRFTFGLAELRDGVGLVPLIVGLFGLGEVLAHHAGIGARARLAAIGSLWPTRDELKAATAPTLRGTMAGGLVGLLPGGSTLLAALFAVLIEKRVARDRHRYGSGALSGVAAPEAANNAAAQTGLIPLIGLGLPANPAMAVLMGAFMLHGISVGPILFQHSPEVFTAIIVGMVIANLALVILNLPLVGLWVRLLQVPMGVLVPVIVVVSVIGTYAQSRALIDVWLLILFGALGFGLRKAGFPLAPIVFGAVLAPLFEDNLRRALLQARGDVTVLATMPVASLCLIAAGVLVGWRLVPRGRAGPLSGER
jgi:putative tricarboxylic transport membrane protein